MVNRIAPPVPLTGRDDIGGAVVRRTFSFNGNQTFNGQILTEKQVKEMKAANFRALRDNGYIQVFPKARTGNAEKVEGPVVIDTVATPKQPHRRSPVVEVSTN